MPGVSRNQRQVQVEIAAELSLRHRLSLQFSGTKGDIIN
jgi:hypothetical protein